MGTELFKIDGSSLSAMRKSLETLSERIAEVDDPAPYAAAFVPPATTGIELYNTTPWPSRGPVAHDHPATPVLRLTGTPGLRRWEFFRSFPNAEELLSKALLHAWVGDPREADELYDEMVRLTSPPRLLLRGLGTLRRPSSDDEAEEELYSRHRAS